MSTIPNFYIAKHDDRLLAATTDDERRACLSKARAHYCSLTTQRHFGESIEQFHLRRPDIAEFSQWLKGFNEPISNP